MLRVPSTLPDEVEHLIYRVIGCCITVHHALGPGLLESTCSRAVCVELRYQGLHFEKEKPFPVFYRGHLLSEHRIDIIVAQQVVLEVKCVSQLGPIHHAQLLNYLRISKLRVGLLVNFNTPVLKDGVKRIIL